MEEYRTQNEDLREENQRLTEELESAAAKYAKLDGALTDEKDASADIQKQSVEQIRQLGEENKHLKEEIAQMKIEASTKTEKSERVDDVRSVELERMKEETQRNQLEIAKLKLELEQSNATCARLKKDMESQTLPKDSTELHSLYMREHEQLEFITDYVHHLEEQINTELLRVAPQSQHLDTTPTHEKLSQLIASGGKPLFGRRLAGGAVGDVRRPVHASSDRGCVLQGEGPSGASEEAIRGDVSSLAEADVGVHGTARDVQSHGVGASNSGVGAAASGEVGGAHARDRRLGRGVVERPDAGAAASG